MKVKYPSLELNWLPKPKDVAIPDIVIDSVINCSGYYVSAKKGQHEVNGRFYDTDNGLIVLHSYDECLAPTIAHEFRHHIQHMNGIEINSEWQIETSYKDSIIDYFTTYEIELDALLYEVSHYPDDTNQEWLEWIIKHYEDNGQFRHLFQA